MATRRKTRKHRGVFLKRVERGCLAKLAVGEVAHVAASQLQIEPDGSYWLYPETRLIHWFSRTERFTRMFAEYPSIHHQELLKVWRTSTGLHARPRAQVPRHTRSRQNNDFELTEETHFPVNVHWSRRIRLI